ncbi:histidine kinase [Nostoc linckia]|nr:histidine kinase [Nostoc linckia]
MREIGGIREMRERGIRINNQCPMPNAQCPMPNAQCPMTNNQLVRYY